MDISGNDPLDVLLCWKGDSPSTHIYLLLTEFEVPTVSYGPSFFPSAYGQSARGHKSTGKIMRICNLQQYGLKKQG